MLNTANSNIKIHAFSFTDPEIGRALQNAQSRGVKIQLLLDKTNKTDKHSLLRSLQDIEYRFDNVPGIAHSKVILIDDKITITGSYNFTRAAYSQNAESSSTIPKSHRSILITGTNVGG